LWWSEAQPSGFDYRLPVTPADGEIDFPFAEIGPWHGADWSFHAQTVQTLVVVSDYEDGDSVAELFNDLAIFLTAESAAEFCQ
jgi:hypothetical protein